MQITKQNRGEKKVSAILFAYMQFFYYFCTLKYIG